MSIACLLRNSNKFYSVISPSLRSPSWRFKHTIDYSHVPKLIENDLFEQFVKGSGPGGSAVNKNCNCVVLTHKPTGLVIKCHASRSLADNRKIARELLVTKLDELQNGENSVSGQLKAKLEKKEKRAESKQKKLQTLKMAWKEREGLD